MAKTSYANCGDLSLAYQVFGDGPVELVYVAGFASPRRIGQCGGSAAAGGCLPRCARIGR
ncbi:MAG: hypothetical protein ACLP3C_10645 [Mycobacterium sp.]|uniref:hypothetical protein n=1 Tax=Mycobacterium sp. TaxID=1785 RepID=UPI003F96F6BA